MKLRFNIRNFSTEMAVGGLFFLALLTLGYFTIVLSTENWFKPIYYREICFPNVGGLLKGDHVLARGVRVGTVTDLSLVDEGVKVKLALTEDLTFREGYSAVIRPGTILGGQYVEIDLGPIEAPPLPDDKILTGRERTDLMVEAAEAVRELRSEIDSISEALHEAEVIDKIVSIIDNLEETSLTIRSGRGLVGRLINDEELYFQVKDGLAALQQAGTGMATVSGQVEVLLDDLRQGRGNLGKLFADEALYHDLQAITGNLREGRGSLGRLLVEDDLHRAALAVVEQLADLTSQLKTGDSSAARLFNDGGELFEHIGSAFRAFAELGESVGKAEGSLGMLIHDDELYREVMIIMRELGSVVQDLREQSAIATFGSFIFGAF